MKHINWRPFLLSLFCSAVLWPAYTQQTFEGPYSEKLSLAPYQQSSRIEDQYYVQLEFQQLPDRQTRHLLDQAGIRLLRYQSEHRFTAMVPAGLPAAEWAVLGIKEVSTKKVHQKIAPDLLEEAEAAAPAALHLPIEAVVIFHPEVNQSVKDQLMADPLVELKRILDARGRTYLVRTFTDHLSSLAQNPAVDYIDRQPRLVRLNHENRVSQRINVLNAPLAIGGRELRGQGVCIGVGDGGELGKHIDLDQRVINKANGTYTAYGAHGDHVTGIIGSAGNLNPRHQGVAPDCQLITEKTTMITYKTEDYFRDFGMVLTNNSYGVNFNCETNGSYNYTSQTLDQQLLDNPEMLHLYAAGNSGSQSCGDFPKGYKTVLRYYAAAKNVLTVGAVDENRVLANLSSRGPVLDGRLKPEIVGVGMNVISTGRENNYFISGGTSMAAPSVTGTLALFYQRYRQLQQGKNPEGALIKAIACNTADDLGPAGPDYLHGFGLINGRRAIRCIEQGQYHSGEIDHQQKLRHEITVPAGVTQIKVMLYWPDAAAESYASTTLVNNLDLSIEDPEQSEYLPWILDPAAERVHLAAQRGVDRINNIEQVTIDQPREGKYTVHINAPQVPMGPQKYFITYELISPELELTYPFGKESFMPGSRELLQWDADPTNTDPFVLEYSENGGNSWSLIADNIDPSLRNYKWTVPGSFSQNAVLRIRKKGSNAADSKNFYILDRPTGINIEAHCEGYARLSWSPVGHADTYEVLMLEKGKMKTVAETDKNEFVLERALQTGEQYWFAVRAKLNSGVLSQRSSAEAFTPSGATTCPWNNDVKVLESKLEMVGRAKTRQSLSKGHPISINLKNVGNNQIDRFDAYYAVNQARTIKEKASAFLGSGDSLSYQFLNGVDLSQPGHYFIDTWLEVPNDQHNHNDTLYRLISARQLANPEIELPYQMNFDHLGPRLWTESKLGLEDMEQWDCELGQGEVELIANTNHHYLKLNSFEDAGRPGQSQLLLTLNLEKYTLQNGLFLSFSYYTEALSDPTELWARGDDGSDWVAIYDLEQTGSWQEVHRLNIATLLREAGQQLSSSFQLKFGQSGETSFYYLDNISLETAESQPAALDPFQLRKESDGVRLSWGITLKEQYDHFEIEMKTEEEADFLSLDKKKIRAQAGLHMDYEYLHNSSLVRGQRFYRIKVVDQDGMFRYSTIKSVRPTENPVPVKGYPNPFQRDFTIALEHHTEDTLILQLIDLSGRTIKSWTGKLTAGMNHIPVPMAGDLPPGHYICRVQYGGRIEHLKLVKH